MNNFFLYLGKIKKYGMFKNLSLVSLSMSDILEINVTTIISLILDINFTKIHTNSKIVISMTLLFDRIFNLMKRFH